MSPRRPLFTSEQFTAACDRITVLAGLLPASEQSLRRRSTIDKGGDGFGRGGGAPGQKGGHSDRTGEQAVGNLAARDRDPVNESHCELVRLVAEAARYLELAASEVSKVAARPVADGPGIRWCRSCERARGGDGLPLFSPATRAARCGWCYRYSLEHHCDPPIGLIERRHTKGKLTSKDYAEFPPELDELPAAASA